MMPYREEFVFTESEDRLALAGGLIQPAGAPASPIGIVWIHGNTGTFYDWPYIAIGRALAERGYLFLTGNTRGHDITTTLWQMPEDRPVAGGSAWERLEEAPYDIAGWIAYLSTRDIQQIVLIGHSQGAAKVVYYQAQRHDPRLAGLVIASPDLHGHWKADLVASARQLVAQGRDAELLPALMETPWYRLSAGNLVSRAQLLSQTYASDQGDPYIGAIQSPILAFFGSGHDVGAAPELEIIRRNARRAKRVDTQLLEGADHIYAGHEAEAAALIADWIATIA